MSDKPKEVELTKEELLRILQQPIKLTKEAAEKHRRFCEMLEETTRWSWKDELILR